MGRSPSSTQFAPPGLTIGQGISATVMTRQIGSGSGSSTELLYSGTVGSSSIWTQYSDAPGQIAFNGLAAAGGYLWSISGYDGGGTVTDVWRYDASSDSWSSGFAAKPTACKNPSTVSYNDKVFCFGGSLSNNGSNHVAQVEVYDPATDSWDTSRTQMPDPRRGMGVTRVGSSVFLVSGSDDVGPRPYTDRYDIEADTWTRLANMPLSDSNNVLVAYGNGFIDNLTSAPSPYQYDIGSDTWTERTGIDSDITAPLAAAQAGDKLYIAGGRSGNRSATWEYDPVAGTLTVVANHPSGDVLNGVEGELFDGRIWSVGGNIGGDPETPDTWGFTTPEGPPLTLSKERLLSLRDAPSSTAELQNNTTGQTGKTVAGKDGDKINVTEAGDAEIYGI